MLTRPLSSRPSDWTLSGSNPSFYQMEWDNQLSDGDIGWQLAFATGSPRTRTTRGPRWRRTPSNPTGADWCRQMAYHSSHHTNDDQGHGEYKPPRTAATRQYQAASASALSSGLSLNTRVATARAAARSSPQYPWHPLQQHGNFESAVPTVSPSTSRPLSRYERLSTPMSSSR